jgi:MGT family glycosyltransferase
MRFLFSFTGGSGHFLPTAPFARALARRGHEVLYTCQESMVPTVAAAGWRVEPSGGASLSDPTFRGPLVLLGREAEERVVRDFFAGRAAEERSQRLVNLTQRWRPDLVVRDEMDFGAAVAADAIGVPHAAVAVIAAGGAFVRAELVEEPLAALRSRLGLARSEPTHPTEATEATEALHRYLLLVPVPPGFRDPHDQLPTTAHYVRPAILGDLPAQPGPPAADGQRHPPQVYLTLGTIFPQESGDLFRRVLAGLSGLPVEVTVTIGGAITPAELGDQPPSVRIERFLPTHEVMRDRDLVISHAGSGTVISALALGIPQVLLPIGADQPQNADRCEDLGVGVALDASTATPGDVADAATKVLQMPDYRRNAERIAAQAAALPTVEHATSLLEGLARSGAPVIGVA